MSTGEGFEHFIKIGRYSVHVHVPLFFNRSFRFRVEDYDLCLYGIFDGFRGCQVADFAKKRLPAEILLGQLVPGTPGTYVAHPYHACMHISSGGQSYSYKVTPLRN
jgi:hypothetical protein